MPIILLVDYRFSSHALPLKLTLSQLQSLGGGGKRAHAHIHPTQTCKTYARSTCL
jgi:hypothetical protein